MITKRIRTQQTDPTLKPNREEKPGWTFKKTKQYCTIDNDIELDDGNGLVITKLSRICVQFDEYEQNQEGHAYGHEIESLVSYQQISSTRYFKDHDVQNYITFEHQFYQKNAFPTSKSALVECGQAYRPCGAAQSSCKNTTILLDHMLILDPADQFAYLILHYYPLPPNRCGD